MNVELLYVPECPNVTVARDRVVEAAKRLGLEAIIIERVVADEAEAIKAGMRGSPTIRIEGRDVAAGDDTPGSMSCRLFLTDSGIDGAPSVEDLVTALSVR